MAGSTVDQDWTLSWYTAERLLKCANRSTPFTGQVLMPSTTPVAAKLLDPSTTAPASTGGEPSSEPTRFATWCCMQSGKVEPSPTMSEVPQALAPRILASQRT